MPTEKLFTDLHQFAARIERAAAAREAAEALVNWLDRQDCPAMIGLLDSSAGLEIVRGPGCQPDDAALAWMQSPEAWLTWLSWHEPRRSDKVAELSSDRPAVLMPLRYEGTVYGLLWLEIDVQSSQVPVLAAHLLAARLHHLAVHSRWDGLLANVNAFSRALLQEPSSEAMWQVIHRQLSLLFDASSFFVGLLNPYTSQLMLPLFSRDGVPAYYGAVPLAGLSKAVIRHGTPLLFYDVEAEGERIAKLNVSAEGEQPETRARSWMGVPLRNHRNEVVGLVSIQNLLPGCYSDPDLYLLMFVAGQIAFAVENKRLLQAEQERRKVASTLMDVGQMVSGIL
jgi:FOG: GAF domain